MRITKLRKGNKGTIILGCEKERELEKLKTTVQNKLGEDYKVMEPKKIEPKIKIINVGEKEIKLEEDDLIDTILKQNRMVLRLGNYRYERCLPERIAIFGGTRSYALLPPGDTRDHRTRCLTRIRYRAFLVRNIYYVIVVFVCRNPYLSNGNRDRIVQIEDFS